MCFQVEASVGNADGVFDAAYFGKGREKRPRSREPHRRLAKRWLVTWVHCQRKIARRCVTARRVFSSSSSNPRYGTHQRARLAPLPTSVSRARKRASVGSEADDEGEDEISRSGVPLEVDVVDKFEGATIAGTLCPACTDQQFRDGGGAIFQMRQGQDGACFQLGEVTITGGAVEALADAGQHAAGFLARHAVGTGVRSGNLTRSN